MSLSVFSKQIVWSIGALLLLVGGLWMGNQVAAQGACTISDVELSPSGNMLNAYTSTPAYGATVSARIANCAGQQIRFRVWAEQGNTSGGDVVVGESGALTVGANELVDISHTINSFGEEACVNGRAPQCWYYVTFERTPVGGSTWILLYSSEGVPLQTTRRDVIGYNCDGQCADPMSSLANFPANRQNLQSSYDLTLTSNDTSLGNVQGSGTYPIGTRASAVAAPVFGNQFLHWEEGGSVVSTNRAIQVLLSDSDRSLTAVFATGTPSSLPPGQEPPESPDGECTIGPVRFDPAGNQLFEFGRTWNGDTTLSWLVTDCYGKTLQFALGARSGSRPAPTMHRVAEVTFDDAFYGGSYTANQDIVEFTSNLSLDGGPCDPALFPACQYFFEATDITSADPNFHSVLYTSRDDILRSTTQDVLGFECASQLCGQNLGISTLPLNTNLLQKNYDLTIEVFLDGNPATATSAGFVTGEGSYAFNSDVNVQAIPQPGYDFLEWVDEAGTTYSGERIFVTMNADRNLEARFTSNTLRDVTVNLVGTGTGTVAGDGPQPAEATIELIAQPAAGSRVAAWRTDGGEVIGRASSLLISFVENEQGDLTARANGISLPGISPTDDITLELEIEAFEEIGLPPADSSPGMYLVPCGDETKPDIDIDGDGVLDDASDCDYNFIILMISRIINFIFLLVLPLAGVVAVVTGIMILTSGGNPSQRQKAKSAFLKFFIGIIIVMVAWLLVATVLRTLGVDSAYTLLDGI